MSQQLFGISGSLGHTSRTHALVGAVASRVSAQFGASVGLHDLDDFGPTLGQARKQADLAPEAQSLVDRLVAADALIVGSPVYKGSYTGLFKHLFDLIEPPHLPQACVADGNGRRRQARSGDPASVASPVRLLRGGIATHRHLCLDVRFHRWPATSLPLLSRIDRAVA